MNNEMGWHMLSFVATDCEDFHNAGLDSEECKKAIETVTGSYTCSPTGINGNWKFLAPDSPTDMIFEVEQSLLKALDNKEGE